MDVLLASAGHEAKAQIEQEQSIDVDNTDVIDDEIIVGTDNVSDIDDGTDVVIDQDRLNVVVDAIINDGIDDVKDQDNFDNGLDDGFDGVVDDDDIDNDSRISQVQLKKSFQKAKKNCDKVVLLVRHEMSLLNQVLRDIDPSFLPQV